MNSKTAELNVQRVVNPLKVLIDLSHEHSIPLVVDLGCFRLDQDRHIYDERLGFWARCNEARNWAAFGESFDFTGKQIYFPRGVYQALFDSTCNLDRLLRRDLKVDRTYKAERGTELLTANSHPETGGLARLKQEVMLARRAWHTLRVEPLRKTIPDVFDSITKEKYESQRKSLYQPIFNAFDNLGIINESVQDRLESLVAGAIFLAGQNADHGVNVATYNSLVPAVFDQVYEQVEEKHQMPLPSRIVVYLFNKKSEVSSFSQMHSEGPHLF